MKIAVKAADVLGLPVEEQNNFDKLVKRYNNSVNKNDEKSRYYEGKIPLAEVNLGLALPKTILGLEIECAWGGKTVDTLAGRSRFDGYVDANGNKDERLLQIVRDNKLIAGYKIACRDELTFGCSFATVIPNDKRKAVIDFHSPETASAIWDSEKKEIYRGLTIVKTEENATGSTVKATLLHFFTDTATWVLENVDDKWTASEVPHKMGRCLMEPMTWNATSKRPFGQSRIKSKIRRLMQGYVRTVANATIGLEFATAPQKYLLGVTDDQYDVLINQSFKQYVGNMMVGTRDPETGENPTFGQLPQGNIEPHVQMLRILSAQFSAASSLPVTDVGVINDANPTSSDAILAQTVTLVSLAEDLNTGNGDALKVIAEMALAIEENKTLDQIRDEGIDTIAHFKNPAMPSVAVTADAAIKIASARPGFAETDIFLEMVGFDQADIRRIKSQEQRARGLALLTEVETDEDNS